MHTRNRKLVITIPRLSSSLLCGYTMAYIRHMDVCPHYFSIQCLEKGFVIRWQILFQIIDVISRSCDNRRFAFIVFHADRMILNPNTTLRPHAPLSPCTPLSPDMILDVYPMQSILGHGDRFPLQRCNNRKALSCHNSVMIWNVNLWLPCPILINDITDQSDMHAISNIVAVRHNVCECTYAIRHQGELFQVNVD